MTRLPPVQPTGPLPFLGRYQLQKKIAVGGMAELYLALASGAGGFQKQVVVKRILPQLAESEELFQMFLDEARIAATLQHANIVQVYDACEDAGEFFMAMEYLDGTDLRTLRRVLSTSNMAIGWEHSLHIVSSIASGLHYAHQKCAFDGTPLRIVHRDVSPQNIFLTREGSVKLVDFGIAKAEGRTTETAMGTLKGKLAYMAPEQCASENVDHRADIYSLGVILYELTTGRRLYSSKTEYQLINEIVEGDIRVPSTFMDYPAELERIVLTCLKKDPNERYESARDIQADLNVFARDYQLICSTLGFSIFIEPLLEQARLAAEERWQHRKEIRPIRVRGSQVQATPECAAPTIVRDNWMPDFEASDEPEAPMTAALAPARASDASSGLSTAPPKADRADEIIEDFLSAKHKVAPRRSPRATSTPLAINTSYISTGSREPEEDRTRPVPTDMLQRIRREERERLQNKYEAGEHDAVPRLARGSLSGEVSVSTHIVRRETGPGAIVPRALESAEQATRAEPVDEAEPASRAASAAQAMPKEQPRPDTRKPHCAASDAREASIEFVDIQAGKVVHLKTPSPQLLPARAAVLPVPADQSRIATALVAPTEFALVADADLSIKPKRSKLWWGVALVAGAGIAAALLLGDSTSATRAAAPPAEIEKPRLGSLTVQATAEAEVWLLLGKTPLQDKSVHGQESILLRIEHEGYQSREMRLGPRTWQRDAKGVHVAQADILLSPEEGDATPEEGDATPEEGDATPEQAEREAGIAQDIDVNAGAKHLRLRSTPAAADAWLYVGTTPNVEIDTLITSDQVELRIVQEGQLPMYRSVAADKFDAEGRASLHLILPAPTPRPSAASTATEALAPVPSTDFETGAAAPAATPKVRWRPRRKTPALVPGQAPGTTPGKAQGTVKAKADGPGKPGGPARAGGAGKPSGPARAGGPGKPSGPARAGKLQAPIPDWAR